jgi:acetyltransferase
VKILNPAVSHKTEAGGVHLNVGTPGEMAVALTAIDRTRGSRYLIERTAAPGPELILAARRDVSFGPMVVLGTGGVAVEIDDDIVIRLAPVGDIDARDMLGELRLAARYRGHRGNAAVDENALAAIIRLLGELLISRDDISEVEINPLRVTSLGLIALDALVIAR